MVVDVKQLFLSNTPSFLVFASLGILFWFSLPNHRGDEHYAQTLFFFVFIYSVYAILIAQNIYNVFSQDNENEEAEAEADASKSSSVVYTMLVALTVTILYLNFANILSTIALLAATMMLLTTCHHHHYFVPTNNNNNNNDENRTKTAIETVQIDHFLNGLVQCCVYVFAVILFYLFSYYSILVNLSEHDSSIFVCDPLLIYLGETFLTQKEQTLNSRPSLIEKRYLDFMFLKRHSDSPPRAPSDSGSGSGPGSGSGTGSGCGTGSGTGSGSEHFQTLRWDTDDGGDTRRNSAQGRSNEEIMWFSAAHSCAGWIRNLLDAVYASLRAGFGSFLQMIEFYFAFLTVAKNALYHFFLAHIARAANRHVEDPEY